MLLFPQNGKIQNFRSPKSSVLKYKKKKRWTRPFKMPVATQDMKQQQIRLFLPPSPIAILLKPTAKGALLGKEESTPQGVPSHRFKHDCVHSKTHKMLVNTLCYARNGSKPFITSHSK